MVVGVTPGALAVLPAPLLPDAVLPVLPTLPLVVGLELLPWLLLPHPATTIAATAKAAIHLRRGAETGRNSMAPPYVQLRELAFATAVL
jgi:hypothetical protein